MAKKETKTPEYTRRAIDNYRKNHKTIQISMGLDDLERMKAAGMTTKDIKPIIMAEIVRRENGRPAAAVPASGAEKETPGAAVDPPGIEFEMPFG